MGEIAEAMSPVSPEGTDLRKQRGQLSAGRDLVTQADQFTVDSAMAPGRVLGGQAQHEITDLLVDRWSAGPCVRVGPVAGEQLAVPSQQRRRSNEERRPTRAGQQSRQRRQHQPVGWFQVGEWETRSSSVGETITELDDTEQVRILEAILPKTAVGALVLSAAVPEAFGTTGLFFAVTYLAIQIGRSLFLVFLERG
jgi:hypothetical protein